MSNPSPELTKWRKDRHAIKRRSFRLYVWVVVPLLVAAYFLAMSILREGSQVPSGSFDGDALRNSMLSIGAILTASYLTYRYEVAWRTKALRELGNRPDLVESSGRDH